MKLKKRWFTTYYWGFREVLPAEIQKMTPEEKVYVVEWDPSNPKTKHNPFNSFFAHGAGVPDEPSIPIENKLK